MTRDVALARLFAAVEMAMGIATLLVGVVSDLDWWWCFPIGWAASACFYSGLDTWREWSEVSE